jgi:hypothetical protein
LTIGSSHLTIHLMARSEEAPSWLRKGLAWTAVFLLLAAAIGITLVATGWFDPQPLGQLDRTTSLTAVSVPAESTAIQWLAEIPLPPANYTVRLVAAFQGGETDVAYGLAVGDKQHYLVTAVSPLGYLVFWEQRPEIILYHLPWQTWPYVRPSQAPNEIWLEQENGRLTLRLNRELLWRGEVALPGAEVGLFTQSFGQTAVIDFQTLHRFTGP